MSSILEGSAFFFGQLKENQRRFAHSLNAKNGGKLLMVLKAYLSCKVNPVLPIYDGKAIHKVVDMMFSEIIPKSTISNWLDRVPELLLDRESIVNIIKELSDDKKVSVDEVKKYSYEEWVYMEKIKKSMIHSEYKALMCKMANPKMTEKDLMDITGASQRLLNKIIDTAIMSESIDEIQDLSKMNMEIMTLAKSVIIKEIGRMPVFNMRDLKALSGIANDQFMQQRLLDGQSTANHSVIFDDIYNAVLDRTEKEKIKLLEEGEIQEAKEVK